MPFNRCRATFYRAYTNASREEIEFIFYHGVITYQCTEISTILRVKHLTAGIIHCRDLPTIWDSCLDPTLPLLAIPFCRGGYQRSQRGFHISAVQQAYLYLDHPLSIRKWLRRTVGLCIKLTKAYQRRNRPYIRPPVS